MGTVAARLSGLQRILQWDGENMKFTNINADEQIRVPKSVKLDTTKKSPRYQSDYEVINALEFAESLINLKPRSGWELIL
jgi:hypothetical protein